LKIIPQKNLASASKNKGDIGDGEFSATHSVPSYQYMQHTSAEYSKPSSRDFRSTVISANKWPRQIYNNKDLAGAIMDQHQSGKDDD
jgi:hypothetical protein